RTSAPARYGPAVRPMYWSAAPRWSSLSRSTPGAGWLAWTWRSPGKVSRAVCGSSWKAPLTAIKIPGAIGRSSLLVSGQPLAVEDLDASPLHRDHAGVDQPMQDAREGFRLNAQFRGDQALGHVERDHAAFSFLSLVQKT